MAAPEIDTKDNLRVVFDDAAIDDLLLAAEINGTVEKHSSAAQAGNLLAEMAAAQELLALLGRLQKPARAVILQNRDRGTPAMIAQMTQIASGPDYYRVAPTKEFASGTPIVFGNDNILPPGVVIGRKDKAVSADGQRFPVRYAVVEAADLLTSNKADGTAIDAYASGAHGKLRAIAGNGRLAGLIASFDRGTAADYVRELAEDDAHGISPDAIAKFSNPVLVRIMNQEDVTENIGDISNQRGTSDLSPVEQSQNDSKRLDLSELDIGDDGKPGEAAALAFIAAMPESERNNLMDGKHPGQKAYDRLMAAVFWKAYGDAELVRLYAQSVDSEVKTILGGMASASGDLAKLEGAGELDIRGVISEAAALAVNAKRQGVKLSLFAQQADMTLSPDTMDVVRMFAENIRSAKKIGERLRDAARFAFEEFTKEDNDMFGAVEKADRAQVLKRLETPVAAPEVSLFDAIDPMLELELSGKLVARTAALAEASEDDPMAAVTISGEIIAIIQQLKDADVPDEAPAVDTAALADKRDMYQDMLTAKPDHVGAEKMRAEIERINGIIGAPVAAAREKSSGSVTLQSAKEGDPAYIQPIFDLRYEWEKTAKYGTAKAIGMFKNRLRAIAKTVPMSDERAVMLIDNLITKVWGGDYDPKVAAVEFATAAAAIDKVAQAAALGAQAFADGKSSVPAQSVELAELMRGEGNGVLPLLTAYSDAWHAANMAAPVPEADDVPESKDKSQAPAVEGAYNTLEDFERDYESIGELSRAAMVFAGMGRTFATQQMSLRQMMDGITEDRMEVLRVDSYSVRYANQFKNLRLAVHHMTQDTKGYARILDKIRGPWAAKMFDFYAADGEISKYPHTAEATMKRFAELSKGYKLAKDSKAAAAPVEPAPLDPTSPEGYAALTSADESRLQDKLDSFFQGRLIDVRNALRDLGWDGEQRGNLSKNGVPANFTFRQVGAGANVVGMSINGIEDDLTRSTADLAAAVDAALPAPAAGPVAADDLFDPFNPAWLRPVAEIASLPDADYAATIAKLTDSNMHSEALALEAGRTGSALWHDQAVAILNSHLAAGGLTPDLSARAAALRANISGNAILTQAETPSPQNNASMQNLISIAADSIDKLRRIDVYRVLNSAGNKRESLATYIIENRPDLQREVLDVMAEEWPDLGYSAPAAPTGPVVQSAAGDVAPLSQPLAGTIEVPPVLEVADAAPAANPQRAADLAFLQGVISQNVDMWADDLAEKIEALGEVYAGDAEAEKAWGDAIKSYTDFMVEAMSKP